MWKKALRALVCAALAALLAGCQAQAEAGPYVAPYDLTEDQEALLTLLGLEDEAQLFSLEGPQEATALTAHAYVLEDGAWVENGGVSMLREAGDEPFSGAFGFRRREDRSLELFLSAQGRVSFTSEPVAFEGELVSSGGTQLTLRQEVALGDEVPVAAFVEDSGTALKVLDLEEIWKEPACVADMDVVQVVTLEFSAQGA